MYKHQQVKELKLHKIIYIWNISTTRVHYMNFSNLSNHKHDILRMQTTKEHMDLTSMNEFINSFGLNQTERKYNKR